MATGTLVLSLSVGLFNSFIFTEILASCRAGVASVYQSTCGGDGSATACYLDNVINNGTKYNDAYFELSYVKVFSVDDTVLLPTVSGGTTVLVTATATDATAEPSGTNGSSGSSGGDSGSGGSNGADSSVAKACAVLVGGIILAAVSWTLL